MATEAHTSKGIVLVLSCAAQFMVVLDIAIVNVALPSIQQDLGIGQSTLQWIVIAYGLILGGFLLLGGTIGNIRAVSRLANARSRFLGQPAPLRKYVPLGYGTPLACTLIGRDKRSMGI